MPASLNDGVKFTLDPAAKGDMEAIKREVHLALRLCGTGAGVSQPAEAPK